VSDLRERIAMELFSMNTGYIGGGWGGESETEQREWFKKADAILALVNEAGLREAANEAVNAWLADSLHITDERFDNAMGDLANIVNTFATHTEKAPQKEAAPVVQEIEETAVERQLRVLRPDPAPYDAPPAQTPTPPQGEGKP
jgi:hypothetical protein